MHKLYTITVTKNECKELDKLIKKLGDLIIDMDKSKYFYSIEGYCLRVYSIVTDADTFVALNNAVNATKLK